MRWKSYFGSPKKNFCVWPLYIYNWNREISFDYLQLYFLYVVNSSTRRRMIRENDIREFLDLPWIEGTWTQNLFLIGSSGTYQFPISKQLELIILTFTFWLFKYAILITFVWQVKCFLQCKLRACNHRINVYQIRSN